jgi:hypothetical protein
MRGIFATLALLAAGSASAAEPEESFDHIEVRAALEAGAAFFSSWPTGKTIHAGTGYLPPYGAADYWCGVGYAEATAFPLDRVIAPWMLRNADDKKPLFCVYRTKGGDLYAYDILVGAIEKTEGTAEKRDALVNFIVGGTGDFAGATGLWVGTAAGRGATAKTETGPDWPKSIIKQMEGYIRLPTR